MKIPGEKLQFERMSPEEQLRTFSPEPVPVELIENAIRVAGLAPSGATRSPGGLWW